MQILPGNSFVQTPSGSAGATPRPGTEVASVEARGGAAEQDRHPAPRPVETSSESGSTRRDLPRGSLIDIRA